MENVTYNAYKIRVEIHVECRKDTYTTQELASARVDQTVTIPAMLVKERVTQLVRQAVANMSISATTGLAPIIASEPTVEVPPNPAELTI